MDVWPWDYQNFLDGKTKFPYLWGSPCLHPCTWGSRTVTRCGYLIDFTGFQSTFCRSKGSFHTQCMYLHSILLSFLLYLVTGNSFKDTHNWGVTMFSSWLYILQDIDQIFSNITDIYEFSVTFLGLLDAAIEVADEGKQPAIGECFEEMAEVICVCMTPFLHRSGQSIEWSKTSQIHFVFIRAQPVEPC